MNHLKLTPFCEPALTITEMYNKNYTHALYHLFNSRLMGIFLFATAFRPALGPTQPPVQWVPGALSPGVKRPGREANQSPPSSVEVKNAWRYTSTPQYGFMTWCLVKHGDNFTCMHTQANENSSHNNLENSFRQKENVTLLSPYKSIAFLEESKVQVFSACYRIINISTIRTNSWK
jgi:hypothetical protein